MKKTDWFDEHLYYPERPGVYQIQPFGSTPSFSHWDGKRWGYRCSTVARAWRHRRSKALGPIKRWRGLAKEPKQ